MTHGAEEAVDGRDKDMQLHLLVANPTFDDSISNRKQVGPIPLIQTKSRVVPSHKPKIRPFCHTLSFNQTLP